MTDRPDDGALVTQYPSLELCVLFSDDGQHIRKWSRLPFDGGACLYSHPASPAQVASAPDRAGVEVCSTCGQDNSAFVCSDGFHAGLGVAPDRAGVDALEGAANAYRLFADARAVMNAAIPAMDATPAERALYSERYMQDYEAEREHHRTAIVLAQHAAAILAALSATPSPQGQN